MLRKWPFPLPRTRTQLMMMTPSICCLLPACPPGAAGIALSGWCGSQAVPSGGIPGPVPPICTQKAIALEQACQARVGGGRGEGGGGGVWGGFVPADSIYQGPRGGGLSVARQFRGLEIKGSGVWRSRVQGIGVQGFRGLEFKGSGNWSHRAQGGVHLPWLQAVISHTHPPWLQAVISHAQTALKVKNRDDTPLVGIVQAAIALPPGELDKVSA